MGPSKPPKGDTLAHIFILVIALLALTELIKCETLTPPYFNLAEGKNITATATCGVDTEGPELYCKLIGSNSDNEPNINVIQGQYCDVCDPNTPGKNHPPEYAVDGKETWWQSPPLSRGMKYQEVNLTIDLGQEFHVAYVYIYMANSPRPGLWVLEKSADYGKTYTPWWYFSDSPADCEKHFGKESLQPITRDDSVICTTEFSKIVPLEGGEIPISLLKNRPSALHYFNSTVLQEWTRATNVRLRFLRTKNLLAHLMSVARQDHTVTRRYFYSIKDISIGGRCMCNGHAQSCDNTDLYNPKVLVCNCQHNTCGVKCEKCCPGFEQKKWKQSQFDEPFKCEPCNCHGHTYECEYDPEVDKKKLSLDIHGNYEGGGVCKNCRHNTEGVNCNKCKPGFFRPYGKYWNETDVCQPCQCDVYYSTGNCAEGSGQCECRENFKAPNCDSCSFGFYDYPTCKPCECFINGTLSEQCEPKDGVCWCKDNFGGPSCSECAPGFFNFPECKPCGCDKEGSDLESCEQSSGNCTCKVMYSGAKCDKCQDGYFDYPKCNYCNCDIKGTRDGICDKLTGKCICKEGYGGERCDICIPGYYGYPDCKPCDCSTIGSRGTTCSATGKCECLSNYAGQTCEQCSAGFYNYPECKSCECNGDGSIGVSCDGEGKCVCKEHFDGQRCGECKKGYYNFPDCEDCNCHPAGVVAGFAGCGSVPVGELCECKERVQGRICNKCRPLFWNLNPKNPEGCEECNCNKSGVLGGIQVCDTENGQCVCKPSVVARGCTECVDGTYNLQEDNLFGCTDCGCDVGGSISNTCNKQTGQCLCQTRVTGRTCKEPLQAHYFPTLYQYQYEIEDGHTQENFRVRYDNNETVFKNYSWKGYAVFSSNLQREVIQDIIISKPSLYRMVLRFVNPNPYTVIGGIKVTPDNPNENEQYLKVQFKNSNDPVFTTVSGESSSVPLPLVLNPGRWSVSINVNDTIYLDYFVLLPEDFYLATVLNQKIETPCTFNDTGLCRVYDYPNITSFDKTYGVGGYIGNDHQPLREFYLNTEHLNAINIPNRVPVLNPEQPEISFNLTVAKPGPHVLLINYVTPVNDLRTHKINVTAPGKYYDQHGRVILYSCPYNPTCRQVVTDEQGGVGVFEVQGNSLIVDLKSNASNVGIHSLYLIPYQDWSLDFIKPKPVCIKKNGDCIAGSFRNPPETKKIQFEQEMEGELARNRPPIVLLNNISYISLNKGYTAVDMRGKVPSPGYYSFVLQYHQPDYPVFDLDVIIQNGRYYQAKVPVEHCPAKSGCRSLIIQPNMVKQFDLLENFMISFSQPEGKHVYLDYLLVIPADLYGPKYLEEEELSRADEFISTCGSNNFNIDTSHKGFCRDSVFSITAAHNTGALPCQCDYAGSASFECEKFGGQCKCKDNIIGRQCTACKTGYYGFPNCRPCDCPSTAFCEPQTGECVCPPHVTGEKCDECEPLTFGYDSRIGCEECKCNPLGINGTMQCDLLNGLCPCKENVDGRTCENCQAGYFSFPYCQSCECNENGTTTDICDKTTAECFCKKNTVGFQCSICREGSFNLQAANPEGCTQCYCSGKAARCTSAGLVNSPIYDLSNWTLVELDTSKDQLNVTILDSNLESVSANAVGAVLSDFNDSTVAYFAAPPSYLGKKLTSYGGFLRYTIFYSIGSNGTAVSGPDVILQGANTYLSYSSIEQPPPVFMYNSEVSLVESIFDTPSGDQARREHFMEVLKDLRGVYIRASYWTQGETTRLIDVSQDEGITRQEFAERYGENQVAPEDMPSVERCACEPNYQGLSCEECSPGYYRVEGPYGGACVPCECNGHANECDVNTGKCLDCQHNTTGDYCELCAVGYHGDARAGKPDDCLICACPLPITSNNFATGCDVSADGEHISCQCRDGYGGARCESCAPGFYGLPEVAGDFCKPCQCHGNIDSRDPGSCDSTTGKCMRCLNNTFGEACSLCAPGYFGDAIERKDCQACICDKYGTDRCDHTTGQCICKPNVEGEKCDRCVKEHFGFLSGLGCTKCDCAEASDSHQCDDTTGQCRCREGVTGRTCNKCAAGFWNYTEDGCVSCGCKGEFSIGVGCSPTTGQCECLPGVIGEKCDQCPHRWVFVPGEGCHQCDHCHFPLLDDTDALAAMIDPIILEFNSTQSGYFTRRKLDNMREQLEKLLPKFDDVDPRQVSLTGPLQELESLEQDSKNLNRKSNYSLQNSEEMKNDSIDLKNKAEELLDNLSQAEKECIKAIEDLDKITGQLHEEAGNEVEKVLEEAESLLEAIKVYNLTEREKEADDQLKKVDEMMKNVTEYKLPVDELETDVEQIKDKIKEFNDRLDDLYNHTQYSLTTANEAEKIINKSGKDRLEGKLDNIQNQITLSKENLDNSETLLKNASNLLDTTIGKLKELEDSPDQLETRNAEFQARLDTNDDEIKQIKELKPNVQKHADDLSDKVEKLQNILSDSQLDSNDAIKAARAYTDIAEAVKRARNATDVAKNDTDHAVNLLRTVSKRTTEADSNSSIALDDAHKLYQNISEELKPLLRQAIVAFGPLKASQGSNEVILQGIEQILDKIDLPPLDKSFKNASDMADKAIDYTNKVDEKIKTDFVQLPEEKSQAVELPKRLDDVKRNLDQTRSQIMQVNEMLPNIIDELDELPEKQRKRNQTSEDVNNKINKLNNQIQLARDLANRLKIGVKFFSNTTLELRNPDNIEDLTTSTKISGYFRTDKPNGLIFYLGNPNGTNLRKTKTDDYMALVVQNGYPVLKLDIGNGPEQVNSEKFVADNVWRQFIIERVGHNLKLSIREELKDKQEDIKTVEKNLKGPYTILNLDKEKSKLFVGSFPPNYEMQKDIDVSSFDGEIEELVIGNKPVSLWNFVNGYENNHGAQERDKLIDTNPNTGLRFNGQGYAIMDATSIQMRNRFWMQMRFKTFASEGLLFLAGKEKTFVALELRNGKVLYQYNLGHGTKKLASTIAYNDGHWHTIVVERDGPEGQLKVDDQAFPTKSVPITGTSLEAIDTVSFGGYPHVHNFPEVTNIKYDGCIELVTINSGAIDLRKSIKSYDVTPGCPAKISPMVSFNKSRPGYVGWDHLSVSNDFRVTLKFKTKEKDGLIFYMTDMDQSNGVSLSLVNGYLKVISQKTELVSKDTFNDSDWHVVSVIHNNEILRVDFDDYGFRGTDSTPPPLHILHGKLFVGGLPRKYSPTRGALGSDQPFHGCIADLTVNGRVMNFANTTDKSFEILDRCILDRDFLPLDPTVHRLPEIPPLIDVTVPPPTVPVIITENPYVQHAQRGDLGLDFRPTTTQEPPKPIFKEPDASVAEKEPKPVTKSPRGPSGTVPTTTPKPTVEGCALPLIPTKIDEKESGYRFGFHTNSRLEFNTPRGKFRKNFDFDLEFKTSEENAIIFYVSDVKTHKHYAALLLQDGYLVFTFKGEHSSPMIIKSQMTYNDDKWHKVDFSRDGSEGKMVIDFGSLTGRIPHKTVSLDLHIPFYLGGVPQEDYNFVSANINTTAQFNGCIRNFNMNNKPLENPKVYGVIPCSENYETGTWFGGGDTTYIKLKERYNVGEMFNIKMDIKPRVNTGVLLAVHGKKDFLVLEMLHGQLRLTVENGRGPVVATYSSGNNNTFSLCDGRWHEIQAVKSKNVVTLSVDNMFTDPKIGAPAAVSSDTGSGLFLGGHRLIKRVRGITSRIPFVGCIKNVSLNNDYIDLSTTTASGNITVGSCRTD
ncbi:laminin subunit alpha [Anthonomus grandis grandis]|uniref:laminin subunit alpha n=1 Tax=Anthonomus grandis grandis TaxID=2921223 RepID=UPI0021659E58|nr:laminin subunit alpha [Anthonomus grandis grandis]